jgi:hypothetical protein
LKRAAAGKNKKKEINSIQVKNITKERWEYNRKAPFTGNQIYQPKMEREEQLKSNQHTTL